ncbi:MAG: S8 family serine peptidase, partial [Sedimentisphaerales bacterium]|nr:S8 family serine peptidase [Sedimentisphaerales bacterium]
MGIVIHFNQRHISLARKVIWLFIFFAFATSIVFGSEADYVPGEVLVRFKPKDNGVLRNTEEKTEILSSLGGGTITRSFKLVPGLSLVKLPEGTSVESALAAFSASAEVAHVQPNYIYHAASTFPNDPRGPTPDGGELWGLHNTGQTGGTPDADIDAPEAWDIATDSDIIVAVIDTGIDYTHPDLAANMWTDSDGSHGYDFVNNDNDPNDDNGHGTHCAGIIGAIGNNSRGVTGVCWNVKIMALKFMNEFLDGTTANAISCIEYAVYKGAKVLSNSYGWYNYDQFLKNAIDDANSAGVLFIAAAGNDGFSYPQYPARFNCSNIISVLMTNNNDTKAPGSNYGADSVDLGAPGTNILSCEPNGQYVYYSGGTSLSTPYVAGACALVWSLNPSLSHLEVKNIILNSVDQKSDLSGRCVTGGRLNLYNALA